MKDALLMQHEELLNLNEFFDHPLYHESCLEKSDELYKAFTDWWDRSAYSVIEYETPIINEIDRYGGTPDMIACDKNFKYVMDIKTGFVDRYSCCLQLSAYAKAWEINHHGEKLNGLIIGFEDILGENRVKTDFFSNVVLQQKFYKFMDIVGVYRDKRLFEKEVKNVKR